MEAAVANTSCHLQTKIMQQSQITTLTRKIYDINQPDMEGISSNYYFQIQSLTKDTHSMFYGFLSINDADQMIKYGNWTSQQNVCVGWQYTCRKVVADHQEATNLLWWALWLSLLYLYSMLKKYHAIKQLQMWGTIMYSKESTNYTWQVNYKF